MRSLQNKFTGQGGTRRALVIDERTPATKRDAGSNAIMSHMQSLQRLGYSVSFAATDLAEPPAALLAGAVECWSKPWVASIEEVLQSQARSFDLVYIHRTSTAARYAALVRQHQPRARLVLSIADLASLRQARQAVVEKRLELRTLSRQTAIIEANAAWYVDALVTHSSVEAQLLRRSLPRGKVHIVPWAVPTRPARVPFADRNGLAFIGHYSHQPNVDAAQWLIDAVVPALKDRGALIPCVLVGANMPDRWRIADTVEAIGAVNDLGQVFDRVRLTVAPLAFGAGIKGKVLDSLAAGIPCVCTPVAAEGLDLPPLLLDQVASSAEDFAAKIIRLHEDENLNAECTRCGLEYIRAFASEERIDKLLGTAVGASN